jgi:fission process protein 1
VAHEGYKAYVKNQKILHPEKAAEKEAEKDKADGKESTTLVKKDLTPGHVPAIEDYRAVMVQRAIFQTLASMGLPAFTIHSIVRYSGKALKNAKNVTIRTYGPIGVSSSHLHSILGTDQTSVVGPRRSTSTAISLRRAGRTHRGLDLPHSF